MLAPLVERLSSLSGVRNATPEIPLVVAVQEQFTRQTK